MGSCHEGLVGRAGYTRLRVGGAARLMISSLRSDKGGVTAVENLCIVRAKALRARLQNSEVDGGAASRLHRRLQS